jgi:GDP-L-fucose synthase
VKILITGGTGFIGQNLLEQLKDEYDCHAPSSTMLNLLDGDGVYDYLKDGAFDIVIHTATWNATRNSKKDISRVLDCNLRMFFNLARCSNFFGKMMYYGSGAEYDREHWIPKMTEEYFDTYVPQDEYGLSKYIMCKYAALSKNIYNLRLFGVFGKYEDWEIRFISNACCKAVYDLPITIKQDVNFDYMHVDDLVKITRWFIQHSPEEKVFNVCSGRTCHLRDLAEQILAVSKKTLDILVSNKGVGREYSGCNARLLREMGDFQFRELTRSLEDVYLWYLHHQDLIDRAKLLLDK